MRRYLCLALLLTGCSVPKGDPGPIEHFHKVNDHIYRGAQPDKAGVDYLKSIGVDTIVDLNDDVEAEVIEQHEAEEAGIRFVPLSLPGLAIMPRDTAKVALAIKVMASQRSGTVFIHCAHGVDRTGLVVALYRVWFENKHRNDAYAEWLELGHSRWLFFFDWMYWKLTTGWV